MKQYKLIHNKTKEETICSLVTYTTYEQALEEGLLQGLN